MRQTKLIINIALISICNYSPISLSYHYVWLNSAIACISRSFFTPSLVSYAPSTCYQQAVCLLLYVSVCVLCEWSLSRMPLIVSVCSAVAPPFLVYRTPASHLIYSHLFKSVSVIPSLRVLQLYLCLGLICIFITCVSEPTLFSITLLFWIFFVWPFSGLGLGACLYLIKSPFST